MDENVIKLNVGNNNRKKYKIKMIWNSAILLKKLKSSYLLRLYYLII